MRHPSDTIETNFGAIDVEPITIQGVLGVVRKAGIKIGFFGVECRVWHRQTTAVGHRRRTLSVSLMGVTPEILKAKEALTEAGYEVGFIPRGNVRIVYKRAS